MVRWFSYSYLFVLLHFVISDAAAHPVAQGAMQVDVDQDAIKVKARVSTEQVFVAEALGGSHSHRRSDVIENVWRAHGDYMAKHFCLVADGVPLSAQITGITPPATNAATSSVTYDLKFDLSAKPGGVRQIVMRQDVLNEFFFAPRQSLGGHLYRHDCRARAGRVKHYF